MIKLEFLMNRAKATMFDIETDSHLSKSGNYCIDITPDFNLNVTTEAVLVSESNLPYDRKFLKWP